MTHLVIFEQDAREAIQRGVTKLARTVRTTLGPRGRNVMIARAFGPPTVTKDGVTVAREIELEDKYENVGAQMVREVASKTSDIAGDGTTTATVLADSIFHEGLKVTTAGVNPIEMANGMSKCVTDIVEKLKSWSIPVKGRRQTAQVATVAANNDSEIGNCIADALEQVGRDGVVTVEQGQSLTTEVEWVQGMRFDKGYLSPYFVSDAQKMECILDDPYILIYENKMSHVKELLPLLEKIIEARKPLLLIAEDVSGEALTILIVNQLRGTFQSCAIKAPAFGDRRRAVMEDLAILTGGTAVMSDLGVQLESMTLDQLGRAKQVIVGKEYTTIIEGAGRKQDVQNRIAQLDKEIEEATSEYDREQLKNRKAKLSGGVAKISVGGATESEVQEKTMRFDDALSATRAALEEGVLPGGGAALLRAADACQRHGLSHDEQAGYDIVKRACASPLRWIANNAGQNGGIVVERVRQSRGNDGYNAATDVYEDLVKSGIIDATKVVRCGLESAASVATLLLNSAAIISDTTRRKS